MKRGFLEVDVFGKIPYRGNPLAVVLNGEGLSTEEMQDFARWTNFSETTFLVPPTSPDADYKVRIFTLQRELPFAGHPTLGTCHAWLSQGGKPRKAGVIVQECGVGNIPIRQKNGLLAFAAPPLTRDGPVEEGLLVKLALVLGIKRSDIVEAQWVDNGPGWVGLMLKDAEAVLAVEGDFTKWDGEGHLDIGLIGAYPPGSECAYEVRALFSGQAAGSMIEDPVTGSLNASLAQWMLGSGRIKAPYRASQGTCLGRQGRPEIDQDADGTIWIGGTVFTCVSGEVEL